MEKCKICSQCGGCDYQGIAYEEQLKQKQAAVERQLGQYGKVNEIIAAESPYFYRNKVHHVFGKEKNGSIVSGFYQENSHHIVKCELCQIEQKTGQSIIKTIEQLVKTFKLSIYDERTGRGFLRHVLIRNGEVTGEILVVLVTSEVVFPSKNNFVKALLKIHPEITTIVQNLNRKATTMVLGEKNTILYGRGYIEDILCNCRFRISPNSFYQVNVKQTEVLYRTAISLAGLTKKEVILDAYCGTGTIGIVAAKEAKQLIGVELNGDAVKDAIINARENGIANAWFYKADATDFVEKMAIDDKKIDVLFMDPPRAGSTRKFIDSVRKLNPRKIVYVSCNPETQSRDLMYFKNCGYRVNCIQPVDMFPMTKHVETVCLLSRETCRQPKDYIKVGIDAEEYYAIKHANKE